MHKRGCKPFMKISEAMEQHVLFPPSGDTEEPETAGTGRTQLKDSELEFWRSNRGLGSGWL